MAMIVGTCVTVYAWYYLAESRMRTHGSPKIRDALQSFQKNMVLSLRNVREGRYYTVVTSAFTHLGLAHLAFNMITLYSFAPLVITTWGVPIFASLYFGAAVSGSFAELWWWKTHEVIGVERKAVGASGAIFGIIGSIACAAPKVGQRSFLPYPICYMNLQWEDISREE